MSVSTTLAAAAACLVLYSGALAQQRAPSTVVESSSSGETASEPEPRGDDRLLERLEAEERARATARAAAEAAAEAQRIHREKVIAAERERAAAAAAAATLAFERRRDAMRGWHASFVAVLHPVLEARTVLYRRMPRRLFTAVRSQCEDFARAAETAEALYRPAPERYVEVLARDLMAVYRESARHCVAGGYFSFTVEEANVRRLVGDLIVALEPYGLAFPVAAEVDERGRRRPTLQSAPRDPE